MIEMIYMDIERDKKNWTINIVMLCIWLYDLFNMLI